MEKSKNETFTEDEINIIMFAILNSSVNVPRELREKTYNLMKTRSSGDASKEFSSGKQQESRC